MSITLLTKCMKGLERICSALANSKGMGAQAYLSRRNYPHLRMKQTFGKPLRNGDNATDALKTANPEFLKSTNTRINCACLGSFDPEIAKQQSISLICGKGWMH